MTIGPEEVAAVSSWITTNLASEKLGKRSSNGGDNDLAVL
jgi:hypothetical protein